MFNKEKIISELQLKSFGSKGWLNSSICLCPECNTYDKFGIFFTQDSGVVHCFKDSHSDSLYNYLKSIGRDDLIPFDRNFSYKKQLSSLSDTEIQLNLNQVKKQLPIGFKRIYYDDYLEERGFIPIQYNLFNVGYSTERRLNNYIVFLIKNKQNEIIAWLARSKRTKRWHEQNIKDYKANKCELKLRYINSENTDFSKILLGENEITENTKTIYLTEGIMDKANVDRKLNLYISEEIKCLATFGNSLTPEQQQILINKGIEDIFFLWDFGTNSSSKRTSMKISKDFKSVKIAEFKDKNIDAGESSKEQLDNSIQNSKNYFYFYMNRLGELKLK